VPNPGIFASLTTLITGGNSRENFPGPPLDQKRRDGSTYSDAHHFYTTPVFVPRPRDLPHCSENIEPAEKSTSVVQAPLLEAVRRDLDLIDQIANSRAKQRENAITFGALSPDESSMIKSRPSHPHLGQESSAPQPRAEPRSGISRENLRRPMLSSVPYAALPNSLPANGIPPLPGNQEPMMVPFASPSSTFSRPVELQHEVVGAVGGGGGGYDDVSARIRAAIVRGELTAA
jgi:hypothetical protein